MAGKHSADVPPIPADVFVGLDLTDTTDAASAFWPKDRHALCVLCGERLYKVNLSNERGTYVEFRHESTGNTQCPPTVPTTDTDEEHDA